MVTKIEQALGLKQINPGHANDDHQLETDPDPFRYGWRTVAAILPNGAIGYRDLPLTQADFLNPQLGDHMVQSDQHLILVISLYNRFNKRYVRDATTGVFSDIKMLWGMPGLSEPAPDLAIVPNLRSKHAYHPSFDVAKEQTRPCLIVEVVSPNYPGDDTAKVAIYARAGIAEYIIINPHFEDESLAFELVGYRLHLGHYQAIEPNAQGRLFSATTGVWFGLDESERVLVLIDAVTGERLLTDEEEYEARLEEQQARLTAEARAEAAEAEIERLKTLLAKNGHRE